MVVDFGLPVTVKTASWGTSTNVTEVEKATATYGDVTVTGDSTKGLKVTYTPNKVLQDVDTVTLTNTKGGTYSFKVYPASTVYYEEGFANYTDTWSDTGDNAEAGKGQQVENADGSTEAAYVYGYDSAYSTNTAASSGSAKQTTELKEKASFDFTGTGIDLYVNCTEKTGVMLVNITDANNKTVKMALVDTIRKSGETDDTKYANDLYGMISWSATDLPYGKYTVTITHLQTQASSKQDRSDGIMIDGFRVYNTLRSSAESDAGYTVYKNANEENPSFIEVRDLVLAGMDVKNISVDYKNYNGSQVYKDLTDSVGENVNGLVISTAGSEASSEYTYGSESKNQDILDNGPKGELFLYPGKALVLSLTTSREVQVGFRTVNGETSYSLNGTGTTINSTTDMFYTAFAQGEATGGKTLIIENTGDNILSVTKLKVCDDPNAVTTITEDELTDAMMQLGYVQKVPMADASLTITVKTLFGRTIGATTLTYNGEEGTSHTFTKDEIKAAATEVAASKGYKMYFGNQYKDVTVNCGESAGVKYLVTVIGSLFNR